jgi:hypothetical protein
LVVQHRQEALLEALHDKG